MARITRLALISALAAIVLGSAVVLRLAQADFAAPLTLQAATPQAGAQFGFAAASGDINDDGFADIAIGAPKADFNGHTDCGEVTVFLGPSLAGYLTLHATTPEDGSYFGWSLATADFDGDGFADVAVGSPYATSGGRVAAGSVTVFFGPAFSSSITVNNPQPDDNAHFGFSVASADVNGDGRADLLVGAPDATVAGLERAGKSFIFLGPSFLPSYALQAPQPEVGASFGISLAGADVDRDGLDDIVVGASNAGLDGEDAGLAFVFRAPSFNSVTTIRDPEPQPGGYFGRAVAGGDFNADGYDDVLIGAYGSTIYPHTQAGKVFTFLGPALAEEAVLVEPVAELDVSLATS